MTVAADMLTYDAFGLPTRSPGTSTQPFGFTGEQSDASTGLAYLRARYLNPAVGRFVSADTVSPNAPGTQGYNPYAYVANNPMTSVDPSGHAADTRSRAAFALVAAYPDIMKSLLLSCLTAAAGAAALAMLTTGGTAVFPAVGLAIAVCATTLIVGIGIPALVCALDPTCAQAAIGDASVIGAHGSLFPNRFKWDWKKLKDVVINWPLKIVVTGGKVFIESADDCVEAWNLCRDVWWWEKSWPDKDVRCTACLISCVANLAWDELNCPPPKDYSHYGRGSSSLVQMPVPVITRYKYGTCGGRKHDPG
jgi:RHS repeat-associated protein